MNHFSFKRFTLIELLVLVAILSVILSLLMPSFKKITNSSQNIECRNNLKNLHNGLLLYIDDFDHILPGPTWKYVTTFARMGNRRPRSIARYLRNYLSEFKSVINHVNETEYQYSDFFICPSAGELDDQGVLDRKYLGLYYQLRNPWINGGEAFGRPQYTNNAGKFFEARLPQSINALDNLDSRKFLQDVDQFNNTTKRLVNEYPAHQGMRNHVYLDGNVGTQIWDPNEL